MFNYLKTNNFFGHKYISVELIVDTNLMKIHNNLNIQHIEIIKKVEIQ